MNSLISVKDFRKKYRKHIVLINDLTINKRVNLLVGKNGSGKSTLLKGISQLISYDGEIIVNGKTCFMSEEINYPNDLFLIEFLIQLNRISKNPINPNKIDDLLVNFDLFNKKNKKLNSLSKGMKAKVNIVQCLMESADIYLLDEPLSGLDKKGVSCLISYIKESTNKFVISTHLATDFSEISNEVFYL